MLSKALRSTFVRSTFVRSNAVRAFSSHSNDTISDARYLGVGHSQYNIFNEDPNLPVDLRLVGPFGTINEPTMVFSPKPYRIVGCTGSVENPHFVGWFVMEGYLKHMCPQCGQMFKLTTNPDEMLTDYIEKDDVDAHFLA